MSTANKGILALFIGPLLVICGGLMAVAIGLRTMLAFLAFEIGMGLVMVVSPGYQLIRHRYLRTNTWNCL